MKKIIIICALSVVCIWSAADVDKFAKIFGQDIIGEDISGYIDGEGKLWVTARKWHTKKVISGTYVPGGKKSPKYRDIRTVPYLYFWLYNRDGTKIRESALGDSVELITLIPVKNGGVLIIPRIQTDIGMRMAHPTSGYLSLILLDKNGVVKQRQKLPQPRFENFLVHKAIYDYEGNIYLTLVSGAESNVVKVHIDDGKIHLEENVKWLPTTEMHILDVLKKKMLPYYDIESQKWRIDRPDLSTSHSRKFEDFDLYPLASYPWMKDEYEPELQSVRLNNGNIIVTVFLKEDEKPVAYQMLFDPHGKHVVSEEMEILNPEDVRDIPDGNKMFIKRLPVWESWVAGKKFTAVDVYIWGYGENGMLYWRKYRID